MTPAPHNDVLENGLRVVTVELPHLHTATAQLYVKVGSRFETPEDNGLSHFLEHMLFRGTEKYPSSYALNFAIERLGGTLDAETGRDYSMLQISVAPDQLDQALALLAEVVTRPRFDDIDLEREIILEEINEDYDEGGVEVSAEEIARRLMFGDHPLGYRITGPRANVARFSLDDVRRHHAAFYRAGNMILAVAGPVKRGRVCEAAARYLSGLAPGDPATAETPAFEQTEARFEYAEEPGSQTSVDIVFRAVPEVDDDYTVSLALLRILDDGMATRLHYRLCDQLGLAYSVGASIEPLHDVALLEIDGATAHAKVIDFMHAAFAVLDQLRNEPCTPDELDKVKRRYRYDMAASRDDAHSMASWFGGTALYRTPPALQDRVEQMDAVTAQDIQRVARQILRPDRLAVVVIGNLSRARRVQVREIVQTWGCQ